MRRFVYLATALAMTVSSTGPAALAQPEPPQPPPWVPTAPMARPGSFRYSYDLIRVGPPPLADARGTSVGVTVDPAAQTAGLPGSVRGDMVLPSKPLVNSSVRFGIAAGAEAPAPAMPGVSAAAGVRMPPKSESATGEPPAAAQPPESGLPAQMSELLPWLAAPSPFDNMSRSE